MWRATVVGRKLNTRFINGTNLVSAESTKEKPQLEQDILTSAGGQPNIRITSLASLIILSHQHDGKGNVRMRLKLLDDCLATVRCSWRIIDSKPCFSRSRAQLSRS